MPHPDQMHLYPPQDLIRSFALDVAAEVPAVRLSRSQWASICNILRDLAGLHDSAGSHGLGNALIEGRLIADAARQAREIRHRPEGETL